MGIHRYEHPPTHHPECGNPKASEPYGWQKYTIVRRVDTSAHPQARRAMATPKEEALAAVAQTGGALRHAAAELRADHCTRGGGNWPSCEGGNCLFVVNVLYLYTPHVKLRMPRGEGKLRLAGPHSTQLTVGCKGCNNMQAGSRQTSEPSPLLFAYAVAHPP